MRCRPLWGDATRLVNNSENDIAGRTPLLKWLTKASEKAQRKNIERTLGVLVPVAAEADAAILRTGGINPSDVRRVSSLQRALLTDLVGPVPLPQLRAEYLNPLLTRTDVTDGVKLAVQHVFDSADKQRSRRGSQP